MKHRKTTERKTARKSEEARERVPFTEFVQRVSPFYEFYPFHRHLSLELSRFLSAVEREESPRLLLTVPPRHGKSELCSIHFPAWVLGEHPDWSMIHTSYTADLSNGFSRKVRNMLKGEEYQRIYPGVKVSYDSRSVGYWNLEEPYRGTFVSTGVGGPITGRGGKVVLIDDPVKNREDANSEVFRASQRDWYTSTLYTRLEKGAGIILVQCMTGDTQVLMSNGAEKALRDVRPGDRVASYDKGRLSAASVLNWKSQGFDRVFTIRMNSGIIVRANERHPFLVERDGGIEWTRLKDLKIGDSILRAIGENGAASPAPTTGAINPQGARDTACPTTTKPGGKVGIDRHQPTQNPGEEPISGTATVSTSKNTTPSLKPRAGGAPSAGSLPEPTCGRIGAESSVSITTPKQGRSEDCCATTATLRSDTGRRKRRCFGPLDTFEIVPDTVASIEPSGHEEVFDIQVERTESFVANGLVSHNTRWHTDDLAGYVTTGAGTDDRPVDASRWRIVNLPAVCESESDPLGRAIGEPLWPEKYDREALENIEGTLPLRDWLALYQQRPVSPEGNLLHVGKILDTRGRVPDRLYVLQGWDLAISEKTSADWTVGVTVGLDPATLDLYWLDCVRGRWDFNTALAQINAAAVKWKPVVIGLEEVALSAAWLQEARRRYLHPFLGLKSNRDKVTRAMPLADRIDAGKFHADKGAPWFQEAEEELLAFPQGSHDDIPDALGKTLEAFNHMKKWRVA